MICEGLHKALIEEEFGDGIFDMEIERKRDSKGDRLKIAMSGKFQPFKCYGSRRDELAYGLKEE